MLKLDVPGDFYQWWEVKGDILESQVAEGMQESLEYVQKKVEEVFAEYGRFDSFLGFSQGKLNKTASVT